MYSFLYLFIREEAAGINIQANVAMVRPRSR